MAQNCHFSQGRWHRDTKFYRKTLQDWGSGSGSPKKNGQTSPTTPSTRYSRPTAPAGMDGGSTAIDGHNMAAGSGPRRHRKVTAAVPGPGQVDSGQKAFCPESR